MAPHIKGPFGTVETLPRDAESILCTALRIEERQLYNRVHVNCKPGVIMRVESEIRQRLPSGTLTHAVVMRVLRDCLSYFREDKHTTPHRVRTFPDISQHKDTSAYQSDASAPSMAQREEWRAEGRRLNTEPRMCNNNRRRKVEDQGGLTDVPGF